MKTNRIISRPSDKEEDEVVHSTWSPWTTPSRLSLMKVVTGIVQEAKSLGKPKSSWLQIPLESLLGLGRDGEVHLANIKTHRVAVKLTCRGDSDSLGAPPAESLGLHVASEFVQNKKSPNFVIPLATGRSGRTNFSPETNFRPVHRTRSPLVFVLEMADGTLGSWLQLPGSDDKQSSFASANIQSSCPATVASSRRALCTEEQAGAAAQVLSALYVLGRHGAYHGHISPGNVLRAAICGEGTPRSEVHIFYMSYVFKNCTQRVYGRDLFLLSDMSTYTSPSCPRALFEGLWTDVCSVVAIMTGQWMCKGLVENNAAQKKIQKTLRACAKITNVSNLTELLSYIERAIAAMATLSRPKNAHGIPCLGVYGVDPV
jgi:hypothetical protein